MWFPDVVERALLVLFVVLESYICARGRPCRFTLFSASSTAILSSSLLSVGGRPHHGGMLRVAPDGDRTWERTV